MGWKATGQPTVRRQRDKWVVRLDGTDTESGRHRPRQLGTYTSQRAARTAAAGFAAERAEGGGKGTVGWLVDRWVAAKTDITEKSQMQNRWAAGHIRKALGAIRLDQLDRDDIARWYDELASSGVLNKRSITIIRRVLRAALEDALDEGLIRRNPAARVPVPKRVVKPERPKEVDAWDEDQIRQFLTAIQGHRWEGPIRLSTLYGLRRSELLALKWDDIDFDRHTVRIDEALSFLGSALPDADRAKQSPRGGRGGSGTGEITGRVLPEGLVDEAVEVVREPPVVPRAAPPSGAGGGHEGEKRAGDPEHPSPEEDGHRGRRVCRPLGRGCRWRRCGAGGSRLVHAVILPGVRRWAAWGRAAY